MDFVDATLVRLADPASRAEVIDSGALAALVDATYTPGSMSVAAPYGAIFDEFELGLDLPVPVVAAGSWMRMADAERTEARFEVTGLPRSSIRVDALWTGGVTATVNFPSAVIGSMRSAWPSPSEVDAEIVAALGALPADPATLEQECRSRYLGHLRDGFSQPDALTDELFDRSMAAAGASSVSQLLDRNGAGFAAATLQLVMQVTQPVAGTVRQLPIRTAVLVREATTSIADLLHDSKQVRALLREAGQQPPDGGLPSRGVPTVTWILPATLFDDAAWPGANTSARRDRAALWLAREGIALAAVS